VASPKKVPGVGLADGAGLAGGFGAAGAGLGLA
jgi:hypothetical protein